MCRRTVVDEFLFLEQASDALQFLDFVGVVENDPVGMDFQVRYATFVKFANQLAFLRAIKLLHVENELVQVVRIVVGLAQFHLPGADVRGVVVTVAAPRGLPRIRGTIAGLTAPATVEMRGPIVGALRASLNKDGSFEFPAATPGLYYLQVPEAPQLGTTHVVVGWDGANVQLKLK